MGTTYTVKFIQPQSRVLDTINLKKAFDDTLVNINKLMSTYDSESELSILNKTPANTPFIISPETEFVLSEAIRLSHLSHGVLDVTVGPLVNLWGFGPDKRPETIPSPKDLLDAREVVGLDKFTLQQRTVTKHHDKVYIDLSTIAKGYAVDVLADILEQQGVDAYLVEIGGEMRAKGYKLSGKPWIIAIEKPVTHDRAVQALISVGDNAIATSGDYRNYYENDGQRYSHLINPNTGYPIDHNLVSVTVIHPSSMTADGLATALNVMGPEKAKALIESQNLSVLMITKTTEGFDEYRSQEFDRLIQRY